MLDALGLESADLRLYELLLKMPGTSETDLMNELGCEPDEFSEALGNLKRLSLLRPAWTDPHTLLPVSPDVGLRQLLDDHLADLREQLRASNRVRAAVEGFVDDHRHWRSHHTRSAAEVCEDPDDAHDRLRELLGRARREVALYKPWVEPTDGDNQRHPIEECLSRGLAVRCVFLDSVCNSPPARRAAYSFAQQGAELRTNPTLPMQMAIIDDEVAVLPADPGANGGAVILRGPSILLMLAEHFEQTWAAATPLGGDTSTRDEHGQPSTVERAALKLLAQGLTDEAVARRLDVSLRTVRRMMARLMTMLGTRSRFEAGVRATKRGWV